MSPYQFMLPSLLHMSSDNHYSCVDEHDYNQHMQILLPFRDVSSVASKLIQICTFILE